MNTVAFIAFLAGLFIGALVGFIAAGLMAAAKCGDCKIETIQRYTRSGDTGQ